MSKLLLGFATAAGSWHASAEDIRRGLDLALDRLDVLVLDTPDADHVIAKFIARAISDEIIAPAYALGFDYGASPTFLTDVSPPTPVRSVRKALPRHARAPLLVLYGTSDRNRSPTVFPSLCPPVSSALQARRRRGSSGGQ